MDEVIRGTVKVQPPPAPPELSRSARTFVGVVVAAGAIAIAAALWFGDFVLVGDETRLFWLLAAMVLAGELLPITIPRHDDVEEFTTSTTFAFALVLAIGTGPAVLTLAAASALADLVHRKVWWKVLFNLGQYAVSIGAAGLVYWSLGGSSALGLADVGPLAASAATFFVLNYVLPGVGIALASADPILASLRADAAFQAGAAAPLLALAPVVIIVAERHPAWSATVILPLAAVYVGARIAVENSRLVVRLQESLERLAGLNRAKDEFVAVVSHELRTPLTSIKGILRTMLRYGRGMSEEDRSPLLEAADRQSEHLEALIEQLLLVARLDADVEPLRLAPVDVGMVLRRAVEASSVHARGHTIDLRIEESLPPVHTDELKVHQILSNLLDNALKYSPPRTRVTLRARAGEPGVLVTVEDEGPGIPAKEQERVFERFYQVDQSSTREVGGMGLGLYICRRMAQAIGATVRLERSDAQGSVFTVLVPTAPPHGASEGDREARAGAGEPSDAAAWPALGLSPPHSA